MNSPNGVTSDDTDARVHRVALQMATDSLGPCHRQALWCSTHADVWPHGQEAGCNTWVTCVEAAEALITQVWGRG